MSYLINLEQASQIRYQLANYLEEMAAILNKAESTGETKSGRLALVKEIEEVSKTADNLRHNVFKILVLGDLKRGKSTFINALLGEKLLPSDVNPCTAILTVLRYGKDKQVTIYFNNGDAPQTLDFATFKQQYTISPDETKLLAASNKLAFPHVDYAVVECPLALLKKGLEIIDTPGLNDTEARNQLTLKYIYSCQVILFLFKATQPCTLDERRYLQNHLQDRDLTIFFLINAWDEIKKGLVDPDDPEELQIAETRLRQLFKANLTPYLNNELYTQRVFEISSLNALRQQLKDENAALSGTGFPEFLNTLNNFLQAERAIAEFKIAKLTAKRISHRVSESITRRIPLLDENLESLTQIISSVEPEFKQLQEIRDSFQQTIQNTKKREVNAIAKSFKSYMLDLEKTFERDFLQSQPDLNYGDFIDRDKRQQFQESFKRAFERYINDRLASWEFLAKQKLTKAFDDLNKISQEYQVSYERVVEVMNKKLLGSRFYAANHKSNSSADSPWSDRVGEMFFVLPDSLNGAVTSFNTFWQTILASICLAIAMRVVGLLFTSIAFNIFGAILLGLGTVALQAEYVRREFLKTTKKEFAKYIPQIVAEQEQALDKAIERCFNAYETQAIGQIDNDLLARKTELTNLLKQQESHQINRDTESERLQQLKTDITSVMQKIESLF